jgi:hypothetical protein
VNIKAKTAAIRAKWSDATRRRRAGTSIPRWTAPTISTGTLLDAARERIEDEQQEFQMPEVQHATGR